MILAFTGTRKGMTPRQHSVLSQIMAELDITQACHGACVGADEEFHELALYFGVPIIEVWPANIPSMRAKLREPGLMDRSVIIVKEPQPPLDRNWDIIREAQLVVACPESVTEMLRSGTWATVRYAEQLNKTIKVIKPYDDDAQ